MDQLPPRRRWLPPPDLLALLGVVVVVTAIAVPGLLRLNRASNEWSASTYLVALTAAERDFRTNDLDGNGIHDYWTGDVSGLYYVKSPGTNSELKLIEASFANADAKPIFPLPGGTMAKGAYLFQSLDRDDSIPGKEGPYKVDTDKSGRKVHNESIFGFCAFPVSGSDGRHVFFVNQDNTVFGTREMGPRTSFPSDDELRRITGGD